MRLRHPRRLAAQARVLAGAAQMAAGGRRHQRRSVLRRPVGGRRRLALVRAQLAEVKAVAHAQGATVNDLLLAAVTGGLRELLLARGTPTDGLTLYASVPVALRAQADTAALGNQVGLMVVPLPVGEPDPVQRLQLITRATTERKRRPERLASLRPVGSLTILRVLNRYSRHQRIVDLFVTNVPGPQRPLYVLGARLVEAFPVVQVAGNVPLRALLHRRRLRPSSETVGMRTPRPRPARATRSAFAGFRFPADVIVLTVRWYLRFGLSYRDVEELLAERGVEVDHVTIYRWVQRFTPLLTEAARPCRHAVGDRWQVDETYVKVAGRWRYVYRAIDQFGQVVDVFVSPRRDLRAARRFFERAIGTTRIMPSEVVTDQAPTYPVVLEELLPAAWHDTDRHANNHIEADHGRLKARLRPMRGLKQDRSARTVIAGHALVQNLRRGHYELAVGEPVTRRVAVAFDELALVI